VLIVAMLVVWTLLHLPWMLRGRVPHR